MGERPEDKTLDRIDPNSNYEPGNCRWATAWQQCRNRSKSAKPNVVIPSGMYTISQASEISGAPTDEIRRRVEFGQLPAKAMFGKVAIAADDVVMLGMGRPENNKRVAVMIRVPHAEFAAWKRAAGELAVSTWGRKLMNDASGYEPEYNRNRGALESRRRAR